MARGGRPSALWGGGGEGRSAGPQESPELDGDAGLRGGQEPSALWGSRERRDQASGGH